MFSKNQCKTLSFFVLDGTRLWSARMLSLEQRGEIGSKHANTDKWVAVSCSEPPIPGTRGNHRRLAPRELPGVEEDIWLNDKLGINAGWQDGLWMEERKQWLHCVTREMGTLGSSRDRTTQCPLHHLEFPCFSLGLVWFFIWDRVTIYSRLASNSKYSCPSLLSAGITGDHHRAWVLLNLGEERSKGDRPASASINSQESNWAAKKPSGWTVDDIAVQF